ncbi:hypothetical protein EJ03DRAFT_57132 [Teratosphaeria nubilosa]|uniref:Uncharacterized protein n=1 Tax=Teratosphaeria nubilosa TaxID=161662 RepID=A0A6G1KT18_9PEZI|nr:hypothetical protein EJ03DRAFT_57132 [Teratosphaeria nubilosa]
MYGCGRVAKLSPAGAAATLVASVPITMRARRRLMLTLFAISVEGFFQDLLGYVLQNVDPTLTVFRIAIATMVECLTYFPSV